MSRAPHRTSPAALSLDYSQRLQPYHDIHEILLFLHDDQSMSVLQEVLAEEAAAALDVFDRVQLAEVLCVPECRHPVGGGTKALRRFPAREKKQ